MSVALDAGTLLAELERALSRADAGRLVSATLEVDRDLDPVAIAAGSRLASDRWFSWEQPDRGFALAGLGTAAEVVSRGDDRFRDLGEGCARVTHDRVAEEPSGLPAGAGPVWSTGLAFAPDGGTEPIWSSLPPALAVVPEVALVRSDRRSFLTVSVIPEPSVTPEAVLPRMEGRLGSLRAAPLTPADPHPSAATTISGRHPPERYERIVAAAAAFIGASPELLVRRSGAVAATVALAGTTSRSADPAVDDHLGEAMLRSPKVRDEHGIVVRRIERTLRPHSVWVHGEPEPFIVKVGNLQHLATPIRAQLAESHSAIELAGFLHPTPAIGGEPREPALRLIEELEGIDRGWYTGPVGWMDAAEDGEFCVGLRSALLRDRDAHLFAGCGIVADSDPAAELQESELKFEALLPLLAS